MKGIELLSFLSDEQRKMLEASENNYKRYARIYFQIISYRNDELIVKVWQMENPAQKYLTTKELVDRAKGVFEGILPKNTKLHVRPIAFNPTDLKNFSIEDVEKKMEELGLKPKDLVKGLDIDKSTVSLLLSKGRELTKSSKAMLYYFFKYMESNPEYKKAM